MIRFTYPGEINCPGRDMKVCEVIDDFALEETLSVVDHDTFSGVDDLDEAEAEVRDGCIEWLVVGNPALKVIHGICAIPTHILSARYRARERKKTRKWRSAR